MEKKHYIIILITILIAVGLYINFTTNYDANNKFKDIVHDNETLIVGYHQMAPFIYTDKDGNVTGFDAELAQ